MAYNLQQQARRLAFYNQGNRTNSASSDDLDPASAKSHIKRIDCNAPLTLILSALEEDGCVVVNDFTSSSELDNAQKELSPHFEAQPPPAYSEQPSQNASDRNIPLTQLLNTHATLRTLLLAPADIHSIAAHFLRLTTTHYASTTPISTTVDHTLSSANARILSPGSRASPLTRADAIHHHSHLKEASYTTGRDVCLQLTIPAGDISRATGAPTVVPGSHLWGDSRPSFGEVVSVELEKGDALITLGSLYQATGAYMNGEKDETRTLYCVRFCNGVTRPEVLPSEPSS